MSGGHTSSSGGSSSSGSRAKQSKADADKNTAAMREVQAGCPENKVCFECNQRGPTYVDMTIGSFVCTKCSGMLRGITPPHRIKSISMSSFANEEVEFVRQRGNAYCAKVWLGLYDKGSSSSSSRMTSDLGNEESIRDLIIQKYEKKRYYVDPSTIQHTVISSNGSSNSSSKGAFSTQQDPFKASRMIGTTLQLYKSRGQQQQQQAGATTSSRSFQQPANQSRAGPASSPGASSAPTSAPTAKPKGSSGFGGNGNGISALAGLAVPAPAVDPFSSSSVPAKTAGGVPVKVVPAAKSEGSQQQQFQPSSSTSSSQMDCDGFMAAFQSLSAPPVTSSLAAAEAAFPAHVPSKQQQQKSREADFGLDANFANFDAAKFDLSPPPASVVCWRAVAKTVPPNHGGSVPNPVAQSRHSFADFNPAKDNIINSFRQLTRPAEVNTKTGGRFSLDLQGLLGLPSSSPSNNFPLAPKLKPPPGFTPPTLTSSPENETVAHSDLTKVNVASSSQAASCSLLQPVALPSPSYQDPFAAHNGSPVALASASKLQLEAPGTSTRTLPILKPIIVKPPIMGATNKRSSNPFYNSPEEGPRRRHRVVTFDLTGEKPTPDIGRGQWSSLPDKLSNPSLPNLAELVALQATKSEGGRGGGQKIPASSSGRTGSDLDSTAAVVQLGESFFASLFESVVSDPLTKDHDRGRGHVTEAAAYLSVAHINKRALSGSCCSSPTTNTTNNVFADPLPHSAAAASSVINPSSTGSLMAGALTPAPAAAGGASASSKSSPSQAAQGGPSKGTVSVDRYAALKDLDEIFKSTVVLSDTYSSKPMAGASIFGASASPVHVDPHPVGHMAATSPQMATGQHKLQPDHHVIHSQQQHHPFNGGSGFDAFKSTVAPSASASASSPGWATNWPTVATGGAATSVQQQTDNHARRSSPINFPDRNGAFGAAQQHSANPFTGASANLAQLNTSPWPTTGTSPVQSTVPSWPTAYSSNRDMGNFGRASGTMGSNQSSSNGNAFSNGGGASFPDPFGGVPNFRQQSGSGINGNFEKVAFPDQNNFWAVPSADSSSQVASNNDRGGVVDPWSTQSADVGKGFNSSHNLQGPFSSTLAAEDNIFNASMMPRPNPKNPFL